MSKEKQIEEMAYELCLCHIEFETGVGEIYTDYDATAQKLIDKGWQKQSKWISVEDRLPDTNKNVLVYIKGFSCCVYTYMGGNEWEDDYGYWHRTEDANVTHWMPLPEAPKGGE